MLKNFSIGTKLLWGFGLLSVLIAVVGLAGYLCLGYVATEVRLMNDLADISKKANELVDSVNAARNASAKFVIDKNSEHTNALHESIQSITVNVPKLETQVKANGRCDDDVCNELGNMLSSSAGYKKEHDNYVEYFTKKLAADEQRRNAASDVEENLKSLLAAIKNRNEGMKEKNEKGEDIILFERINTVEEVVRLFAQTEQTRRFMRDYELNLGDPKVRDGFLGQAKTALRAMQKELTETIKPKLVTQTAKDNVDQAFKSLDTWGVTIDANVAANMAMLDSITTKDKVAANFAKSAGKVIEMITGDTKACENKINAITRTASYGIVAAIVLGVAIGLILGFVFRTDITTGIKTVTDLMEILAKEGDISVQVPYSVLERKDETGLLGNAMKLVLADYVGVGNLANRLAEGDWTASVTPKSEKDTMNRSLREMIHSVNDALLQVNEAIIQVSTGASQVAQASESLSQGATESAASIEEISASMNEMGSQTNANAQNAADANRLSGQANDAAQSGQEMMMKMISSMEQITKNADDVQKVVKVIDDISFQTNLLALNAAVEAARAGVHGKGFAVVAEEVRNLAARSAKAAAETTQMIENNNRQIRAGAEIASQTANNLTSIVEQSTKVAGLIGEIATASREQALGVSQVSQGLSQIEAVTQQNTASAEETASVSHEMSSQASQLQNLISHFKLQR